MLMIKNTLRTQRERLSQVEILVFWWDKIELAKSQNEEPSRRFEIYELGNVVASKQQHFLLSTTVARFVL